MVKAFLLQNNNVPLNTALNYSDHHALFKEMVNLGLAVDEAQALNNCWTAFRQTPEFNKLSADLKAFIVKTTKHFSETNE